MRLAIALLAAALLLAAPLGAQKAKSINVDVPLGKAAAVERVVAVIVARDLAVASSQDGVVKTTATVKDGRHIVFVATVVATSDSTSLVQWRADASAPQISKAFNVADETWTIAEGKRGFVGVAWTHLRALAAATKGDSTTAAAP